MSAFSLYSRSLYTIEGWGSLDTPSSLPGSSPGEVRIFFTIWGYVIVDLTPLKRSFHVWETCVCIRVLFRFSPSSDDGVRILLCHLLRHVLGSSVVEEWAQSETEAWSITGSEGGSSAQANHLNLHFLTQDAWQLILLFQVHRHCSLYYW